MAGLNEDWIQKKNDSQFFGLDDRVCNVIYNQDNIYGERNQFREQGDKNRQREYILY